MKTAIVGLGPHGKRLLQVVLDMPELALVGVVDRNEKALENISSGSAKPYFSLDELYLEHPDLKVLIITTNGPSHAVIGLEAINKGVKFLFISKPLACSLDDSMKLIDAAKKNNVRMVVDHGLRHDTTYNWIKDNIEKDTWGKLKAIYIQRPGIGLGCLGVHSFDLANFIAGGKVKTVTAWVDEMVTVNPRGAQFVDPGGLVVLNYDNGVRAVVAQIEEGAGPMSVEINLSAARIRVDEKFGVLEVVSKEEKITADNKKTSNFTKSENPHGEPVKHDIFKLMRSVLEELISDKELICDAKIGNDSVEILIASYLSNDNNNSPIALPLTKTEDLKINLPVT